MNYSVEKRNTSIYTKSHMHDQYEIYIPLSNTSKMFIGSKEYENSYGKMFIIKPFEIHRGISISSSEVTPKYIIRFDEKILSDLSTEKTDLVSFYSSLPELITLEDEVFLKILNYASKIAQNKSDSYASDAMNNISFCWILLTIASEYSKKQPTAIYESSKMDERIKNILNYINMHYYEELSLDFLSEKFFICKSNLCLSFKKATGFSLGDYITMYRIKVACNLIKNGAKISQVSKDVGFNTQSNFIRAFKNKMGFVPSKLIDSQDE